MITNNIFIVPLLLFLFLNNKEQFWKQFIWICLGGMTLFLFYFIFLQSPQEFISGILKAMEALNYDKDHGSSGLIIWHKKILRGILIPLIIITIASTKLSRPSWVKYTLFSASLLFLSYTIYNGIIHKYTLFPILSFYFLAGLIIAYTVKNKITIKTYYAILLLVLPYFASFGTDVNLFIKAVFYFPFILVGSIYLGLQLNSKKGKLLTLGFIATVIIATLSFFSYPYRPAWEGGYKMIEQNHPFEFKDATIYFDNERIENLREAYPYLKGEENVLVSTPDLWGYVLITGAKPPYYQFKFNDFTLNYIEDNDISKESLLLLEDKERPFKKEMMEKLTGNKFILRKVELSEFTIYRLEDSNN
ncbi:hypothetical protein [Christiangramia crocea]|uniref:Uncharacterized protein n=1 Tax=Christiangramia crocea TaxID=2904124 RepID=A0A9X1UUE3_9FLAO|nr:hypothetical protein [Gramella crocea]MCG9970430.1 hypothetical protein [Gramella crocea]